MVVKILVVDDDIMMLQAIKHSLTDDGFEVTTAESCLDALEVVGKQKLDLIITDIMMPDISGLSLLSLLKEYYFSKVPVIIISSLDRVNVVVSSLGLGAVDFIAKPINMKELCKKVRKYKKNIS